ncbi:Bifunctional bis(5'-adenosyl)-triphosphatase/adenylylsulfatase FHIT [Glycine soja]|uniref:Bis(5'-adenosyl)-triphosphatase n=1 Tax=Glycine soja TaxID=3848 RepID=A0A445I4X8_GLYSO|nr:Bifunctional bis(5'-adenosyl)-triphosphatase/adenylylsulfatase FHIT [Glycine soja]
MAVEYYDFGPHKIHHSSVFYTSNLSFAFVNLRPAVTVEALLEPAKRRHCICDESYISAYYLHVLVCSKREVKRVADLTDDETVDLWLIAKKLGRQLESYHKASSLTFCIQDGPQAGQSVPHVHIHILPRKSGDYENNDDIYDDINEKEKELNRALKVDIERKDRSIQEMALEADEYRKFVF